MPRVEDGTPALDGNRPGWIGDYKLRLPQLRALAVLAGAGTGLLTRSKISDRAGFAPNTGTLNYALNGMKLSKGNPRPHPGLVELGLVSKDILELDGGVTEEVYCITPVGTAALEAWLAEFGELPPLRDRRTSTNNRYLYKD